MNKRESRTELELSGGFNPPGQMVDPPTKNQKYRLGVVNEPLQDSSHLIIQQPTINICHEI